MYLSTPIKVPNVLGKIVRKKKGESIYVFYETVRVFDPKHRFNVPTLVVIG